MCSEVKHHCALVLLQFERTLIVAEEGSQVSYLEGCTAPSYDKNQVCSTAVWVPEHLHGSLLGALSAYPSSGFALCWQEEIASLMVASFSYSLLVGFAALCILGQWIAPCL